MNDQQKHDIELIKIAMQNGLDSDELDDMIKRAGHNPDTIDPRKALEIVRQQKQ